MRTFDQKIHSFLSKRHTKGMNNSFKFSLVIFLLGRLFPVCATLNTIKRRDLPQSSNWLCFFIFYEIWKMFDYTFDFLLQYLPGYDILQVIILVAALLITTGYSPRPCHEIFASNLTVCEQHGAPSAILKCTDMICGLMRMIGNAILGRILGENPRLFHYQLFNAEQEDSPRENWESSIGDIPEGRPMW